MMALHRFDIYFSPRYFVFPEMGLGPERRRYAKDYIASRKMPHELLLVRLLPPICFVLRLVIADALRIDYHHF